MAKRERQLDMTECFDIADIRRTIFHTMAGVFGEIRLDDACRCECGAMIRCVVNPSAGWAIVWCDRCGWFADQRWIFAETELEDLEEAARE